MEASLETPFIESSPSGDATPGVLPLLRRRLQFLTRCALAGTVLASAIAFLLPNEYTASTALMPPSANSSLASIFLSQLGGGAGDSVASLAAGSLGMKNPSDLQVSLFRSRVVEDAVILRFHLAEVYHLKKLSEVREKFESKTSVAANTRDGIIQVTATARSPEAAAELANGYVAEYRKLSSSLAVSDAARRRAFFEQQMEQTQKQLSVAESTMLASQSKSGIVTPEGDTKVLLEATATLRAQIASKQVEIQSMRSFAAPGNPQLRMAEEQLAALQAQYASLNHGGADGDDIFSRKKLPPAEVSYLNTVRDVKFYQALFEVLSKQWELAKLDEAREGAGIQIIDPAIAPDKKSGPHRGFLIVLGFFLSLGLGSGWVLYSEARFSPRKIRKIG